MLLYVFRVHYSCSPLLVFMSLAAGQRVSPRIVSQVTEGSRSAADVLVNRLGEELCFKSYFVFFRSAKVESAADQVPPDSLRLSAADYW
jgi:hypothetical protein